MGAELNIGLVNTNMLSGMVTNHSDYNITDVPLVEGYDKSGNPFIVRGNEAKYLQELKCKMNFTPVFIETPLFGTYNSATNESSGLIKLLQDRTIDVAMNDMYFTVDRAKVVDVIITTEWVNLRFPFHARCVRHWESQWRSTVHG